MAKARKNAASSSHGAGAVPGDNEVLRARPRPSPSPKRARKSAPRDSPSQRSSAYRGVTRHRWTGRFEAHLWDKNTWNDFQSQSKKKKGRQVYLGAYDGEEAAARAYDLAALKYWGHNTVLNFPLSTYDEELKEMEGQSREEYIGSLRRKSSGFSRGVSKYRGVARHHHNGKWEARIGRVYGNKYLYLGTFATQEEAAMAYDVAAIEHRGLTAVTNFDISRYIEWHHRCLLGGAEDDNEIPSQRLDDNMTQHPTNIGLDEAIATTTIFHDAEQEDKQTAKPTTMPSSTTSALGLLLQSPKFKEMIELAMTSSGGSGSGSTDSSSLPLLSSLPSPPPPAQQMAEYTSNITSSMGCTFPDDVQTFFDFEECGLGHAEVDTFLFGDLGAYAAPMFQCELDV